MKKNISDYARYGIYAYAFASTVSITLCEIFFIIALILWFLDIIRKNVSLKGIFPVYAVVPFAVFALIHVLAAFFGVDPLNSIKDSKKLYLLLMIFPAGIYLRGPDRIRTALNFFAAGSVFTGLYAIGSAVFFRFIKEDIYFRASSFSGGYMQLGGMMMLSVVVIASLLVYEIKVREKGSFMPWLYGGALIIVSPALLFTYTRGSYIGALAGLAVIMFLSGKRVFIAGLILMTAGMFLVKDTSFAQRLMDTARYKETRGSDMERILMWKSGIEIIKDYPVLGVGTANVSKVYEKYRSERAKEKEQAHLHNNIIQVGAINGIPGILAVLWMFGALFIMQIKGAVKSAGFNKAVFTALAASTAAFFINGLFEYNLFSSQVALIFWFLTGAGFALYGGRMLRDEKS
ncbi:MAG: O-antigen ligase family protein [Candidatus Goldiibacteriota bacterium]